MKGYKTTFIVFQGISLRFFESDTQSIALTQIRMFVVGIQSHSF